MKFQIHNESLAQSINGEGPDGEEYKLKNDVLIYFKLAAFEQPVLTRLRASEDRNLQSEIDDKQGFIFVGEPDAVKEQLIKSIEDLFNAIKEFRKNEK